MQNIARGFLVGVGVLLGASGASALEARFDRPTYKAQGQVRLDNCEQFGSACGQPAADHYCRLQGYERAINFETVRASPTRVILVSSAMVPAAWLSSASHVLRVRSNGDVYATGLE